jgi:hypothetical protein
LPLADGKLLNAAYHALKSYQYGNSAPDLAASVCESLVDAIRIAEGPMSFHVPEAARLIDHPTMGSTFLDGHNGAFVLESPEPGWQLWTIASDGTDHGVPAAVGWEHVSVHAHNGKARSRIPSWREMVFIKETFWDPEDVVMQLHPARSQYINNHPAVLHLWRPRHLVIPTPDPILVGWRDARESQMSQRCKS